MSVLIEFVEILIIILLAIATIAYKIMQIE